MSIVAPQGIDSQYWADLARDADQAMSYVYRNLANIGSAPKPFMGLQQSPPQIQQYTYQRSQSPEDAAGQNTLGWGPGTPVPAGWTEYKDEVNNFNWIERAPYYEKIPAATPPTPQPAAQAPSYEPPTYNPLAAWGRFIGQSVAEANPQESAEYARVKQRGLAALNAGQISPYEYNLTKGYYGAKNLVAPVTGQGIGSIIPSYIANFGYQLGQAQRGDNTWGKALNDWAAQNVGSTLYGVGAPPPAGMTWLNE